MVVPLYMNISISAEGPGSHSQSWQCSCVYRNSEGRFLGRRTGLQSSSKFFILKFSIGFICCWWFYFVCGFFEIKNKHLWIKESCFCREFSRIHKLSVKIILRKHNDFNKIKQSSWTLALRCQNQRRVSIRKPFAIAYAHGLMLLADFYQFWCQSEPVL